MKRVCLAMLTVGLLVIPCIANALDANDSDLLLYLAFDGNTDDSSNQGNDGELVGEAEFVRQGAATEHLAELVRPPRPRLADDVGGVRREPAGVLPLE